MILSHRMLKYISLFGPIKLAEYPKCEKEISRSLLPVPEAILLLFILYSSFMDLTLQGL